MSQCVCGWNFYGNLPVEAKCQQCGRVVKLLTSERITRVKAAVAATERLVSWLRFLRHPSDRGIGDTAHRLNMRSCKSPDAHEALSRLLKQCGCKREDAVAILNQRWPYA
jgi:hypothetical protein